MTILVRLTYEDLWGKPVVVPEVEVLYLCEVDSIEDVDDELVESALNKEMDRLNILPEASLEVKWEAEMYLPN
ncbi:MAG TPA: hypothetical protein VJJ48_00755 [Candidatus Paceibacterota bacterium]